MLIKAYQDTIPELKILSIFPPGDHVTNITVAQEIVCLVKKMQKLFPNSLGNFVSVIIKANASYMTPCRIYSIYDCYCAWCVEISCREQLYIILLII